MKEHYDDLYSYGWGLQTQENSYGIYFRSASALCRHYFLIGTVWKM